MAQVELIIGSKKTNGKIVEESGMFGVLNEIEVDWRLSNISAHRQPEALKEHCIDCILNGTDVFIGGAAMSAGLPGAISSYIDPRLTPLNRVNVVVIGVALSSDEFLDAQDALYSMVRMPPGIVVLTAGIGKAGLYNAALAACQIVALTKNDVHDRLWKFIKKSREKKKEEIGIARLGSTLIDT